MVHASGNYAVEAQLVKVDGGLVHLRRADGATIQVPFDRLNDADQRYLADREQDPPDWQIAPAIAQCAVFARFCVSNRKDCACGCESTAESSSTFSVIPATL